MTRPLVVNADDLGLSRGINAAIRRAHVDGIVTSTSLLTVGRYAADAAAMLRATPSLAAGVHLALEIGGGEARERVDHDQAQIGNEA